MDSKGGRHSNLQSFNYNQRLSAMASNAAAQSKTMNYTNDENYHEHMDKLKRENTLNLTDAQQILNSTGKMVDDGPNSAYKNASTNKKEASFLSSQGSTGKGQYKQLSGSMFRQRTFTGKFS